MPKRTTWSSPNNLALLWNVRTGSQLAAESSCPLIVNNDGATIQIHQSVVANVLTPIMGGRVIRSQELDQYVAQFGELGNRIQRRKEDEVWTLTLQGFQPVEVQFDDSQVRFRIRTANLERDDQALDQPATIEAAYRVELAGDTIQLIRDGDIKIDFSGKQQRGIKAVTLRSFLKKKFEELFKPQLFDQPLQWGKNLPTELKDLQLASVTVDDGWIQAHLR
jgi:hypothetical protein